MKRISAVRAAVAAVPLLVLGAGTLRAQRLDTTLSVRGQPKLSVTNLSGNIVIRVWSRREVRVQAEYDRSEVEVTESAGRVAVRTLTRRNSGEGDYTINVPRATDSEINAVSSHVRIDNRGGSLN